MNESMENLYKVLTHRKDNKVENSYSCYLFEQGIDKILKKCGEECSEVIIAAKNGDGEQLRQEICDLLFHLTILMINEGITLQEIDRIMNERSKKIGNLKKFYRNNPNS